MITCIKKTKNFHVAQELFNGKPYKEIDANWCSSYKVNSSDAFNFNEFKLHNWDRKVVIRTKLPIASYYYIHPGIYLSSSGDIIAAKVYQDNQEYLLINSKFEKVSPRQYKQLLKNKIS